MYCGVQDLWYSFTMFDVCALWIVKNVLGEISLPSKEVMEDDWKNWVARNNACKNGGEEVDFQTDYVCDLAKDCGSDYPYDLDCADMFKAWLKDKEIDVFTYRDQAFTCKYTGTKSPVHHTVWFKAMDDSLPTYMATKK